MALHYLGVWLVYAGIAAGCAAAVALVRPLHSLAISSRRRALGVLIAGIAIAASGAALPAPTLTVDLLRTALDRAVPEYQFRERHQMRVDASVARTFEAVREVTADEITLFRTLTAMRRLGRPGPESILDAPERVPILEVATRTTFLLLAIEPNREIVVGTVVIKPPGGEDARRMTPQRFRQLAEPGYAKAVLAFLVEAEGSGSLVTTETRILATDASARRRFAAYWRLIYPGSSLIRWMWLRAIERRAEAATIDAVSEKSRRSHPRLAESESTCALTENEPEQPLSSFAGGLSCPYLLLSSFSLASS